MRVIFTFYRNFIYPATAVTAFSCYLIISEGSAFISVYMWWMKIITSAFLGLFFHLFQSQQLYFFNNLGYSARRLYALTAILDFSIWLILTIATIQFL